MSRSKAGECQALLCVQYTQQKCAGNTINNGPEQYQRQLRNEYQVNDKRKEWTF